MALTKLTQSLIDGTLVTSVNGNTGAVTTGIDLQSSVKTANFTAVANEGYLVNTTSSAITVTLPSSPSLGDEVLIIDYAGTFGTNNVTLTSSNNILGDPANHLISSNNISTTLIYTDATKGWVVKTAANEGTSAIGQQKVNADFLVVAGGGGGGSSDGGGGGAGGLRTSYGSNSGGGSSAETSLALSPGITYSIIVGAGATGAAGSATTRSAPGSDSSIAGSGLTTITSNGGGSGGTVGDINGGDGGSGGGAENGAGAQGGLGTSGQGFNGGGTAVDDASGGGGASAVGGVGTATGGGTGGAGLAVNIISTSNAATSAVGEVISTNVFFAGGGGGGGEGGATGGNGGGGAGINAATTENGDANTGGGAGGGDSAFDGGNGGSGVVILRLPTSDYTGTTTNSPDVYTEGTDTVIVFKSSGTYTA